jgi:hypothetical protein
MCTLAKLVTLLVFLTCPIHAQPSKPDVYLNITTPSEYDSVAKEKYGNNYNIIDINNPPDYHPPEKISGAWPHQDKPGRATALFIVTKEGEIDQPIILEESSPALGEKVLQALTTWTVSPPTLDGKKVSIVTAQEFFFGREEFVQLFMPSSEMQVRVKDINQLAQFIDKIQGASQQYFAGQEINANIVVAIKPNRKARYWIVNEGNKDERELALRLDKLEAPEVSKTVIFSILSASTGSKFDPSKPILPDAWEEAAAQAERPMTLDEVVDLVWREE